MTYDQLIQLVVDMRNAQRIYFRTRDYLALQKSKSLEKQVDAEVAIYLAKHNGEKTSPYSPSLFD